MKKVIILLLLFLVISCNKEITDPSVFRFSTSKGVPTILVTINGQGGMLLIDSGAAKSFIDLRYKTHYDFDISSEGETASGVGGNIKTYKVRNAQIKYNDSIIGHTFLTANLGEVFNNTGIVGIIGSDYLIKHKIIIDYNAKQLKRNK